jgi:hypothetical protein
LIQHSQARRSDPELILFFAFCAALILQAFLPPPVGIANNGDFSKIAGVFCLTAPTDDEFQFLIKTWHFDPGSYYWARLPSTEHLLAATAIGLNRVFRHDGLFDIRMMGAIHAALYLLAFYLVLPLLRGLGQPRAFLLGLVLIVIFADTMYVESLNTFYMDTAALVFLSLAAVLYLRVLIWNRTFDWIGFAISSVLLAGAKAQHAPLAMPLCCAILLGWKSKPAFRIWTAGLVAAAAIVAWWYPGPGYRIGPVYNVIFMEILPNSSTVEDDLR